MILKFEEIKNGFNEKADVCIVGSGIGGGIIGTKLAKAGFKVIILEGGPYVPQDEYNRNAFKTMRDLYMNSGLMITIGLPAVALTAGALVGGTMEIYSGTCLRPKPQVIEGWQKNFDFAYSYNDLEKFFEEAEKTLHVSPADPSVAGRGNILIKKGAEKLGWKGRFIPRSAEGCIGCGNCNLGCFVGAKKTVLNTFLENGNLKNLYIYPNSKAIKIASEKGIVRKIEGWVIDNYGNKTGKFSVSAERFVLSAGSLMTPVLLLHNNICNSNGRVGENLHIHPAVGGIGFFREETEMWNSIIQGYMVEEFEDEGIRIEGGFPPIELFMVAVPFYLEELKTAIDLYKHGVVFGAMIHEESSGKVKASSDVSPRIFYRFLDSDIQKMKKALLHTAELFLAAGAEKVFLGTEAGIPVKSKEDAEELLKKTKKEDILVSAYHPMGTCAMGGNEKKCVVDNDFRARGMENLYICDGSIIPSPLGVNPALTIAALSLLAGEKLKK
jgi:choline dehydrogenase-like flavoprotein